MLPGVLPPELDACLCGHIDRDMCHTSRPHHNHHNQALETDVDFLAVVEHRLVPARVRGEWARLRAKGASSVWSPASQESSMLVMVVLGSLV